MTWKRDAYGREYDDAVYSKGVRFGVAVGIITGVVLCLVIGLLIPL